MSGGEHEDALGLCDLGALAARVAEPISPRGPAQRGEPQRVNPSEVDALFAILTPQRRRRERSIGTRARARMRAAYRADMLPDLMQTWDLELCRRLVGRPPAKPLPEWLRMIWTQTEAQAVWLVMRDLCLLARQGRAQPPLDAVELDEARHIPAHLGTKAELDAWETAHWVMACEPEHGHAALALSRATEWRRRPRQSAAAREIVVVVGLQGQGQGTDRG